MLLRQEYIGYYLHTLGACIHALTSVMLQNIKSDNMALLSPDRLYGLQVYCEDVPVCPGECLRVCFSGLGGTVLTHPPNTMSSCKSVGDSSGSLASSGFVQATLLLMLAVQVLVPRCAASVSNNESNQPPSNLFLPHTPIYQTTRLIMRPVTNKNRLFG